jgi:hypothetical protein
MVSEERSEEGTEKASQDQGQEQRLPLEASRHRVESLWRQVLSQKSTSRPDLAAARASRAKAELERQRISQEALEATRDACRDLINETERQLMRAKEAEKAAEQKLQDATAELQRAQNLHAEADSYRFRIAAEADSYKEKILAEAHQEAQRLREEQRANTLRECDELKRHVTYEVQSILAEVDAIREAAQEELEAQKIYSEAANLKVTSHDVRSQILARLTEAINEEAVSEGLFISQDDDKPSTGPTNEGATAATPADAPPAGQEALESASPDRDSATGRARGSRSRTPR